MLTKLVAIIWHSIEMSCHYAVHIKLTVLYVCYTSIELEKINCPPESLKKRL